MVACNTEDGIGIVVVLDGARESLLLALSDILEGVRYKHIDVYIHVLPSSLESPKRMPEFQNGSSLRDARILCHFPQDEIIDT